MSTFFVTGGAGFIGQAFCKAAENAGHHVFVYDQVNGDDMEHGPKLNDAMKRVAPDWIIHLAAVPGVAGSLENATAQVFGMANLLRAADLMPGAKIIFASTGSVYGEQYKFPTTEDAPIGNQTGYYAAGKLACEGLLSAWCNKNKRSAVSLRLGTIVGPGNKKGLVFDFIRKLRENPAELRLSGNGRQRKSYVHIDDLADMMLAYSLRPLDGYAVVNVGSGDMGVEAIAQMVAKEMGLEPTVLANLTQPTGFGDISRIDLASNLGHLWGKIRPSGLAINDNVRWLLDHPEVFG